MLPWIQAKNIYDQDNHFQPGKLVGIVVAVVVGVVLVVADVVVEVDAVVPVKHSNIKYKLK